MTTKPFTPKLGGARPRLSAALESPALNQFTPRMLAAVQGAAAKQVAQKKPNKNKTSATLNALVGNF
jgi:hypothetical protein